MFNNETLHVVDYYNSTLVNLDKKNIEEYFKTQILDKSKVNIGANNETSDKIIELDKGIDKTSRAANASRGGMIAMRIFGGIFFCVGIILIVLGALGYATPKAAYIGGGVGGIVLGALLFGLSWLVKKKYKNQEAILTKLRLDRQKEYTEALKQLEDLKTRFNGNAVFDIFEKTYPLIHFDEFFSEANYLNWTEWLKNDVNSSTLYCLSGTLKTNPFIVLKTKNTKMYDHVYTGSVTRMVPYTTYINGRRQTSMTTVVITASTTNPAPMYWNETKLFYKSNAANDLVFQNFSAFSNEKKAEKYFEKNKDTEPMDNPEFDKLFPCHRNNETQFRTLFTPLAQEEVIKLMKTKNDYKFNKNKTLNIISSPTFEEINLNYNFNRYWPMFDYREIKDDFFNFNERFFSDIYFMFAPILCIPLYQQYEYKQPLFEKAKIKLLSYMESESATNLSFEQNILSHPKSKTDNIIKTKRVFENSLYEINQIIAHGYDTKPRIVIKTVVHPQAGVVNVPITVIDYIPVQQTNYVVNSYNADDRDMSISNENNPSYVKYFKSLGARYFARVSGISSTLLGENKQTIDKDTYKEFLQNLSKI